jgi:hypothetical protein
MAFLHDDILDQALSYISTNTENLYVTSQEATTFTEASSTYKVGTKATPSFTGPAIGDGGAGSRKITVDAITDGTVDATGTANSVALTDDSATKLLATVTLTANQSVTNGNTFTLNAWDIEIPAAT